MAETRTPAPPSRADVDKSRYRAGHRKRLASAVHRLLAEYRAGRAASACMDDLEKAAEGRT